MSKRKSIIQSDKVNEFIEIVKSMLLPNFKISSASALTSNNSEVANYATLYPSVCFESYMNSSYHYRGDNQFIHFTNYNSCKSILSSKQFRIRALSKMDDNLEVSYLHSIFKSLGLSDYSSFQLKKNLYALSLCSFDIEKNEKSLNMWRNYGDKNKGVALVLEIDLKHSNYWVSRMLSKVHYGDECFEELKEFAKQYQNFKIANDNFKINGIDKLFRNILAYHKAPIYNDEKEIRLLLSSNTSNFENKPYEFIPLEYKTKLNKEDFPMFNTDQDRLDYLFPIIHVKKILIGSEVSKKVFTNREEEINDLTKDYDIQPIIEYSSLKKYF